MYSAHGSTEDYQKAIKEAMGEDPRASEKIAQLRNQWQSPRYQNIGEEASIMRSILLMNARPVHTAIMVDNLNYFKVNYEQAYLELALMEACLCGSRNVADYTLELLKTSYIERPKLLAYIAASPNIEWTKAVALTMAKAKLTMPQDIHRFAQGSVVDTVDRIFKTGEDKPANASPNSMLFKFYQGELPTPGSSTSSSNGTAMPFSPLLPGTATEHKTVIDPKKH
jgi:hypothetical protein